VRCAQRGLNTVTKRDGEYFFVMGNCGFRRYAHESDEEEVCRLCWKNALPGGRPFPLIPEAGAQSFGRIVTGPFARHAPEYFYVVDDLASGRLVGYLTGAEGSAVETEEGEIPWATLRNRIVRQIAADEFGEISAKVWVPAYSFVEGVKLLYTVSLGPRAIQFLLHERFEGEREMPKLPAVPEFHFQVEKGYRGQGIGRKLVEHFTSRFAGGKYKDVCAQVTVCEGQKSLAYYRRMSVAGIPLWRIYDRRETFIYTPEEKQAWGLGPVVENVSLVADRERLLAFAKRDP
jgi:GNAT superfamily N-acetyltransferase